MFSLFFVINCFEQPLHFVYNFHLLKIFLSFSVFVHTSNEQRELLTLPKYDNYRSWLVYLRTNTIFQPWFCDYLFMFQGIIGLPGWPGRKVSILIWIYC